ncbi:MAG: hypothetical protein LUC44_06240 [Prevotellaceae bacterium]|nr:hypothetical protein [Prevotellaceae bacterium]
MARYTQEEIVDFVGSFYGRMVIMLEHYVVYASYGERKVKDRGLYWEASISEEMRYFWKEENDFRDYLKAFGELARQNAKEKVENMICSVFGYEGKLHDATMRKFYDTFVTDKRLIESTEEYSNIRKHPDGVVHMKCLDRKHEKQAVEDVRRMVYALSYLREFLYQLCDELKIYRMRQKYETYLNNIFPNNPEPFTARSLFPRNIPEEEPEAEEEEQGEGEYSQNQKMAIMNELLERANLKFENKAKMSKFMAKFCGGSATTWEKRTLSNWTSIKGFSDKEKEEFRQFALKELRNAGIEL